MKVYSIHTGCAFEGGATKCIYKTIDRAREEALKLVAFEQAENTDFYKGIEPDLVPVKPWSESSPNNWTNGLHEIVVREYEVIE